MYTKGPWKVHLTKWMDEHGKLTQPIISDADDMTGMRLIGYAVDRADGAQNDNARLIASSPDLLEACQDTLTRLEWWNEDKQNRSLDNAFHVLRLAISKAEKGE